MSELLRVVLEAHGGLERWRQINTIDVDVSMRGSLRKRKGWADVFYQVYVTAQPHEQRSSYTPFITDGQQSVYEPDHVIIEAFHRQLLDERKNPRKSF
jgi:hypothetical protein